MLIDYSAAKDFCFCPRSYYEHYEDGQSARPIGGQEYFDFGGRMHELLEAHYLRKPSPVSTKPISAAIEDEAQATFAAYLAYYPCEDFEVVAAEKLMVLAIPGTHHKLVGKIDMRLRKYEPIGNFLLDTKTEKAGSTANDPESWAVRPQVALYEWLCEQITGVPIDGIILNIITRQSEKGRVSPSFRRLTVHRTRKQQAAAIEWITWVADQIEACRASGKWIGWLDNCKRGWQKCEYYHPHLYGWSDELRAKYLRKEDYLGLGGQADGVGISQPKLISAIEA